MSDTQQGPGWWLASDGRWYPPELHPSAQPAAATVVAKGVNGTVTFDGRMVTIDHSGLMGRMTAGAGEKRVPVSSITGVEWKPPGTGVRGFIRFTIPGALEQRSRVGQRTRKAASDENSVLFTKGQVDEFERLREAVEASIGR